MPPPFKHQQQYYKLNPDHSVEPIEGVLNWARAMEETNRRVALTEVAPGIRVSTVFLGLDHSFFEGPPLLFETMVFNDYDEAGCYRYTTWAEAEVGHMEVCEDLERKYAEFTSTGTVAW